MERDPSLTQPITGFPEYLPAERILELELLDTIRSTFESFGFAPIETPAVEKSATLESKGEINKQVYSLIRPNVPEEADKDTGLSMHFDLTIPLARYVGQHYGKLVFPFRRYQMQKVWRGERAQRGRFREFYQCDIDIIGENSLDLAADAEMPLIIHTAFSRLGVGDFVIRMSNRKILQGLMAEFHLQGEQAEETLRGVDRLPKLKGGWTELDGWFRSELNLSDAVLAALKTTVVNDGTPPLERVAALGIQDETFHSGIRDLSQVVAILASLGVPESNYAIDLSIARGLDYYTGTIYETFLVGHETTLGSVCSGGRYDDLASHFIDRKLPGVGVSIGLSRLFAGLLERGVLKPGRQTPAQVAVTIPDEARLGDAFRVAQDLRNSGLNVELSVQTGKHDKQLKAAVRRGIPFAVIPWPEKLDSEGTVELRDLTTGDRSPTPLNELSITIQDLIEAMKTGESV